MNAAHVHLLVNHLPIIGSMLTVPLLLLALATARERGALRAAVLVAVLTAAGGGLALWSGEPAEEVVEDTAGVDEGAIHEHEERAEAAAALAGLTAVLGIAALALSERKKAVHLPVTGLALVGALVSAGAMAWTGAAGGPIRHSEIRGDVVSGGAAPSRLEAAERGGGRDMDDDD